MNSVRIYKVIGRLGKGHAVVHHFKHRKSAEAQCKAMGGGTISDMIVTSSSPRNLRNVAGLPDTAESIDEHSSMAVATSEFPHVPVKSSNQEFTDGGGSMLETTKTSQASSIPKPEVNGSEVNKAGVSCGKSETDSPRRALAQRYRQMAEELEEEAAAEKAKKKRRRKVTEETEPSDYVFVPGLRRLPGSFESSPRR